MAKKMPPDVNPASSGISDHSVAVTETPTHQALAASESLGTFVDVSHNFAPDLAEFQQTPPALPQGQANGPDQQINAIDTSRATALTLGTLWQECEGFDQLLTSVQSSSLSGPTTEHAEETPKKKRRTRAERGLPSNHVIYELAKTYLKVQRKLWPEKAASGELPKFNKPNLRLMAKQFKLQFLGKLDMWISLPKGVDLGCGYLRYSDNNSNTRSLNQQLQLELHKAKQNGHFIPWSLVFADAAVTGTTSDRRGYGMAKLALESAELNLCALYIDEVGRASRDAIEALSLGQLVDQLSKRMIGVSDGYDSTSSMAKMQLSFFAMVHEWFIDQLRSKVNRGMNDAFAMDNNTGLPPVGLMLVPRIDSKGRPIVGRNDRIAKTLAIDPRWARYVLLAFVLFAIKKWSPERIAVLFNDLRVGNLQTWEGSRIRQLLRRHKYVGILTYRMTYRVRVFDADLKRQVVKIRKRPRKEWKVKRRRDLQIIPWSLWKLTKKRLAECSNAFTGKEGRKARTDVYDNLLIRPDCHCCKKPLSLGQTGKYPALRCLNGVSNKNACMLKGYKSVRIINDVILRFVKDHVLTPERVRRTVDQANRCISETSSRPLADTSHLEQQIQVVKRKLKVLYRLIEGQPEQFATARKRIHKAESHLVNLKLQLAHTQSINVPPPPPITMADVERMITRLGDLLQQDVRTAAQVLRDLIGTVIIKPCSEPSKKKAASNWIAEFRVDLVRVFARLERDQSYQVQDSSDSNAGASSDRRAVRGSAVDQSPVVGTGGNTQELINSPVSSDEANYQSTGIPEYPQTQQLIIPSSQSGEGRADHQSTGVWDYLHTRQLMTSEPVTLCIEAEQPKCVDRAEIVLKMFEDGKKPSTTAIAAKLGIAWGQADRIRHFIETGNWPKWPKKKGAKSGKSDKVQSVNARNR